MTTSPTINQVAVILKQLRSAKGCPISDQQQQRIDDSVDQKWMPPTTAATAKRLEWNGKTKTQRKKDKKNLRRETQQIHLDHLIDRKLHLSNGPTIVPLTVDNLPILHRIVQDWMDRVRKLNDKHTQAYKQRVAYRKEQTQRLYDEVAEMSEDDGYDDDYYVPREVMLPLFDTEFVDEQTPQEEQADEWMCLANRLQPTSAEKQHVLTDIMQEGFSLLQQILHHGHQLIEPIPDMVIPNNLLKHDQKLEFSEHRLAWDRKCWQHLLSGKVSDTEWLFLIWHIGCHQTALVSFEHIAHCLFGEQRAYLEEYVLWIGRMRQRLSLHGNYVYRSFLEPRCSPSQFETILEHLVADDRLDNYTGSVREAYDKKDFRELCSIHVFPCGFPLSDGKWMQVNQFIEELRAGSARYDNALLPCRGNDCYHNYDHHDDQNERMSTISFCYEIKRLFHPTSDVLTFPVYCQKTLVRSNPFAFPLDDDDDDKQKAPLIEICHRPDLIRVYTQLLEEHNYTLPFYINSTMTRAWMDIEPQYSEKFRILKRYREKKKTKMMTRIANKDKSKDAESASECHLKRNQSTTEADSAKGTESDDSGSGFVLI
jgi:hypothetical protein